MLDGEKLIKIVDGEVSEVDATEAVKDAKVILLYFSAHWCPPCQGFTPVLKDFYEAVEKDFPGELCVIFVSSDRSEKEMIAYFKEHGDYYAVKQGSELGKQLKSLCHVQGIPMLCHVDKSFGEVLSSEIRNIVSGNNLPKKSFETIKKQIK